MLGQIRPFVVGLCLAPVAAAAPIAWADDAPKAGGEPAKPAAAPYGEDVLEPFVPLRPRTAEDRNRLEALRAYATARSLEDRRMWAEAIGMLEEALKQEPGSVPILRRLTRLCFILNRTENALDYARRVLDVNPDDTEILSLLVGHYERRNDPAGAEALLRRVLDNAKLDKNSPGYLLIQRDLGELYADRLNQIDKAADAFAIVLKALDEKAANQLSLADQRRLLGFDEAATYTRFGEVFFQAKRYELAITAFRRGLVYDPDSPLLPRLLTQTQLKLGRPEGALAALEPFLKRQPQGREPYELLIQALTALKKPEAILPRLEAAAKNDPKNLPLQYLLADRYREEGQPEKADALYRNLLANQPDPQGFGALAASLVREKKTDELIELLGKAFSKPETLEAVKPQIESITNDPAFAGRLLEVGQKLQQADPPRLTRESRLVLGYIATKAKQLDKLVPIERLALQRDPNPQAYREFWLTLYRNKMYRDAAATLEELFAKFPAQKDAQSLTALAQSRALAGRNQEALETIEEALKLDADDVEALRIKGFLLGRLGRNDDAVAHYQMMLRRFPANDEVVKVAHSGLSIIYINQEQYEKGEAELEVLFKRDPDDPGVNNDLGYLYADRGKNLEQAEAMIRKAVDEEPENPAYLDSLGWVLFKRGKVQEALEPLQRAAASTGDDPTILDHLGDVYFKLNQLSQAKTAWQKAETVALKATPPDKRLGEIRKKLESLQKLDPALTGASVDGSPKP